MSHVNIDYTYTCTLSLHCRHRFSEQEMGTSSSRSSSGPKPSQLDYKPVSNTPHDQDQQSETSAAARSTATPTSNTPPSQLDDKLDDKPDVIVSSAPHDHDQQSETSVAARSTATPTSNTPLPKTHLQTTTDSNQATLFGVLVDVSNSMKSAFAVDSTRDASVERIHAIITTVLKIVNTEVRRHNRSDQIFVSAFGLDDSEVNTCDLIALLDLIIRGKGSHDALVELARKHGVSHSEKWIREYLSDDDARDLYRILSFNEHLVAGLVQKIPSATAYKRKLVSLAERAPGGKKAQGVAVHNSLAYRHAQMLLNDKDAQIRKVLLKIQNPTPKSVQYVSQLLGDLRDDSTDSSGSLHSQISELLDPIRSYIFGYTPMCKAMSQAVQLFQQSQAKSKVLLLLSDGESTDGDPTKFSPSLDELNVTRVACFLTGDRIEHTRRLFDRPPSDWARHYLNVVFYDDGRYTLFDLSSRVRNIDTPVSYLVDAGWDLPASGESRLFVQVNSLDVIDELCEVVVSRLSDPCDALVDILEKVPLVTYIQSRNAGFEPKLQKDLTCYANAVAAVFHLAIHRIVGREGGYPEFEKIRDRLIQEYGKERAFTKDVIAKVSPEYRLQYQEVGEVGARQALNHRRPLVATFTLFQEQWDRFHEFYTNTPQGILTRNDIGDGSTGLGGHAVVLIRCTPQCLVFMNSWGQSWGDGGFFSVRDSQVLNDVKFFDIYWTKDHLTQEEKDAYRTEGIKRTKNLAEQFPSINHLLVECPACKQRSKVGEFKGNLTEATCPKCGHTYRPTNEDLVKSLYLRNV